ncbi:Rho GTPase-activating protein 20 [Armadillidium vulgare]|nr:Rho GTPase-activating protein 20 [Armadillidium vulgare]
MNCLREILQECDAEQCGNIYNTDIMGRCQFILRQERKPSPTGIIEPHENGKKVSKKAKKSPIRIHKVFKRSNSKGDVTDSAAQINSGGILFGQPLQKICHADGGPPKPIMDMLHQLFQKGPFTVGIFRKSANARLVRELKEKLDSSEELVDLDGVHITSVAALFKDFLRSLPDCLLCSELYEEWLELPRLPSAREKVSKTLLLCSRLPRPHLTLLQLFLCVLHHIAKRAAENMMSASNLAVCVGPSILWPSSPILALSPEASKEAPATVEFLIERCCNVFGKDILTLLGDPPEQDPLRLDSGAEESDSLHSLHSGHSMHSSGGMRRDDSSIDSLERELIGEGELSPLPRKDKMSLTNLSRDSGLTMSDSQLYTPDEEESGSTSSSHSGGEKNYTPSQQERTNERFQHYTAPNNPNAIYTAVYRRPEKIQQSQYDEPDSYYSAPNREHTRVQITYSTPNFNGNYGNQSTQKEAIRPVNNVISNGYTQDDEDDGIYSVPNGIPSQKMLPFVASSNFQRHDWMRRCSNVRKVSKTNSTDGGLMRSTSEESLLNKYNALEYGMSLGAAGSAGNEQIKYKERILYSSPGEYDDSVREAPTLGGRESPLRRSKSAHQIIDANDCRLIPAIDQNTTPPNLSHKEAVKWHRSRSTPHIHDEGDRSYDSSTLSDDDSTPHVSRSNSRGKEFGNGTLQTWDSSDSHNSRNSSFKSERTGSMCTVVSAGSTSTLSSNPPSYEEALNRRSLMHGKSQQLTPVGIPDYAIREEKMKSARAKQLYEESLRIYQEENSYLCDLVRASPAHAHDSDDPELPPPLPPKSDPPPLPPKQKSNRRSNDGTNRLKHLPPVHVESPNRKPRSVTSLPMNQVSYDPPLHKTIIYTDDSPPVLPPKERTIIEVESSYNTCVQKKNMETQTEDYDLEDDVKDEGIQTSGNWTTESSSPHITSVKIPDISLREGRRRNRFKEKTNSSQRSRSMPGRDGTKNGGSDFDDDYDEEEDEEEEWNIYESSRDFGGKNCGIRDIKHLDPDLQQEISWSVSQLRAIFGDSLKGAKVHPPPYRPPPTHRSSITTYHLGSGDAFIGRNKQRPHSNYGEESYV